MRNVRTKWLALFLVVMVLSAFVVGCGQPAEQNTAKEPVKQAEPAVTIEDLAYNYYENMPEHIYKIDSEELKKRIDAKDDSMLIISIRKAEDYAQGHIPGSVNIPMKEMGSYLDKLPADKDIIIYCYTGQTAGQVVALLNLYGYKARSVNLGLVKGWVGQYNYPLETTVNNLPENVTPAKPDPAVAKVIKDYFTNLPEDHYIITSEELAKKIEAKEDMQIVSIRKAEDYAKGHIEGAINIPFEEVHKHFSEFSKDKPVYVYCYSGQTAGQTVAILRLLGIDAKSLKSGFDKGWQAEGFPVVQ